ncbi:MAG: hemin uptake protein HemP [Rubripirellula sp.]|nr:hemin uptake protein HemP [Rubripirellula sp.]
MGKQLMADGDEKIELNLGASPDPGVAEESLTSSEPPDTAAFLPKIIKFSDLARCGDEVWIEFETQLYRLRKTKQGKLILTK